LLCPPQTSTLRLASHPSGASFTAQFDDSVDKQITVLWAANRHSGQILLPARFYGALKDEPDGSVTVKYQCIYLIYCYKNNSIQGFYLGPGESKRVAHPRGM